VRHASKFTRGISVLALALAGGVGLTRCSLFVDTDGLSGGDSSAPLVDGSTSDVLISQDASTDAGNSPDSAIANDSGFPGCDASHTACDDFETSAFSDRWNGGNVYGGGVAEYVDDASVSPTHSLHSSTPTNPNGAGAALYQNISIPTTSFHCQLDLLSRFNTPQVIGIGFNGGGQIMDYYVQVNLGAAQSQTEYVADYFDGGSDYESQDTPNSLNGAWTHVTLDMQPSGSIESVTLTIGDNPPLQHPFVLPVGTTMNQIQLSADYSSSGYDQLIDNVLCDVQ
jgi:hypothetical protein